MSTKKKKRAEEEGIGEVAWIGGEGMELKKNEFLLQDGQESEVLADLKRSGSIREASRGCGRSR